jgi:class 3 adenylate cyclase
MKRFRAPIWLVLAVVFASLVAITTAVVASRLYSVGRRSTGELVAEIGDARVTGLAAAVRGELEPAQEAARFIADYVLSERVDLGDHERIQDLLLGSLAASPQVIGVALIRSDLYTIAAARSSNGKPYATEAQSGLDVPLFRLAYRTGAALQAPDWGTPVYSPSLGVTGLPLLTPLRRDGEVIAVIATMIAVPELSRHALERIGGSGERAFVLLDDDSVIVHPALNDPRYAGSDAEPLPRADEIDDPVLRGFPPNAVDNPAIHRDVKLNFDLQDAMVDGTRWVYLFRHVEVIGRKPWTAVIAMQAVDPFQDLRVALWFSLGITAVAITGAIFLGRSISRPIRRFAGAARRLSALELEKTKPMQGSWLREFDIAAEAYNGMRAGLTWFSTYVPRSLVPVLMRPDSAESFTSKEREVTVLFTDIVGFTTIGTRLRAPALARFLNRHFGMLGGEIEAEGGTIDKYIGDSVMAFWGAPAAQADHAERAARAALAIGQRLHADNARRARKGLNPVRVRIGIHSGLALAGNIGAPGRINYTLVGDTVNVAQRLEQFGKEIDDGSADVIIVISQAVADRLPVEVPRDPLGVHAVVARGEAIALYRLDGAGAEEEVLPPSRAVTLQPG